MIFSVTFGMKIKTYLFPVSAESCSVSFVLVLANDAFWLLHNMIMNIFYENHYNNVCVRGRFQFRTHKLSRRNLGLFGKYVYFL